MKGRLTIRRFTFDGALLKWHKQADSTNETDEGAQKY